MLQREAWDEPVFHCRYCRDIGWVETDGTSRGAWGRCECNPKPEPSQSNPRRRSTFK